MRRFKRITNLAASAVLAFSALLSMGFAGVAHALPSSYCKWIGSASGNLNVKTNWQSVSSGCSGTASDSTANSVPGAGDNVVLDNTNLTADATVTNNVSSLSFATVTFQSDGTHTKQFTLAGSAFTVTTGFVSTQSVGSVTADVSLGANAYEQSSDTTGYSISLQNLNLNGHNLTVGDGTHHSYLSVTGTLSGSGNVSLTKANMDLSNSSTWQGALSIDSTSYFVANGGTSTALGNAGNTVTIASGGALDLSGMNGGTLAQNITVGGSGSTLPGAIQTEVGNGTSADVTLSGTVTLTSNTTVDSEGNLTVSGPLHGSYTLTPVGGMKGNLIISSSDNQSQTPNGTATAPVQTVTVAAGDNQPNQDVTVGKNQTYVIDGQRGFVFVENGGVLQGTGQVSDISALQGGTVAPGHSPGKLTVTHTLNLANGSTYQAELKDTGDGDFDQLVVGSASDTDNNSPDVTLGGTSGSPTLTVSLYDGFSLKAGDTFTIIDNLSGTDVSGTFANLPEGATFTVSGYVFSISYVGGDGNDVVLTVDSVPSAPDTGFGMVASHPGVTLMVAILAAGTIFGLAQKNRKPVSRRR